MRFKVELRREVVYFIRDLRRRRRDEEVDEFFKQLELLRSDPIGHSEAVVEPDVSRYVLRYFRFRGNIAIFQFDRTGTRIIVRRCRTLRPRPETRAGPGAPDHGG